MDRRVAIFAIADHEHVVGRRCAGLDGLVLVAIAVAVGVLVEEASCETFIDVAVAVVVQAVTDLFGFIALAPITL